MRPIIRNCTLLVLLLFFLLSSCSSGEKSSESGAVQKSAPGERGTGRIISKILHIVTDPERIADEAEQQPAEFGTATLKPPYSEWDWEKSGKGRLTVQNAVWAVAKQVGKGYNHEKSHDNTYPTCREWITPNFENKPWEQAIEDILAPFDLTYVIERRKIVLITVEDAARREASLQKVVAGIDRLVSSKSEPPSLHDAVIIFPLLDRNGRTTELGTLLSVLGMVKAVYTPAKMFNLHVPSVLSLFSDLRYQEKGRSVSPKERERILARFSAKNSATGTLTIEDDGAFHVTLDFQGEHDPREFSMSGTESDLNDVPQWIARCMYEYCELNISPEQHPSLKTPETRSISHLFKLVKLENAYHIGKRDNAQWRQFLQNNPNSVFALYRYYLKCEYEKDDDSLKYITGALTRVRGNELLRFLEAEWHYRAVEYEKAIPRFFDLLVSDFRNDAIYGRLEEMLLDCELDESVMSLYEFWVEHDADSYQPFFEKADFYIDYAWHARDGGRKKFMERLNIGAECHRHAYELNPTDPRVPTEFISYFISLGHDRDEMEKWFNRAIAIDPSHYDAYLRKLAYLQPGWHGRDGEMLAFARECAATAPEGSIVAKILLDAHNEMADRSSDEKGEFWDYFKNPDVWKEVKMTFEKCLEARPNSLSYLNYYAKYAYYAGDYEEAARLFRIIGADVDLGRWNSENDFYKARAESYDKAGVKY